MPRFQCKHCHKGFSRQTFRMSYRDHKPDRNLALFKALASGLGLRQTARIIGLSVICTEQKFRKIARHCRRFNLNLRGPLESGGTLVFDELETFEGRRGVRPLSVPMLIERDSRYIIWAESAPIRPHGRKSKARERAVRDEEARFGPRKDLSRRSVERTLRRGADLLEAAHRVILHSDEKPTYPGIAREVFGAARLEHWCTNSELGRDTWNPLFPINHTEAMGRDSCGRLRRDSWLVSKKRRYLDLGMQLWMAWRNYVRRRFNYDEASPAQQLGFVSRRLTAGELLSWRQDWGRRSIHPLSWNARSVEAVMASNGAS